MKSTADITTFFFNFFFIWRLRDYTLFGFFRRGQHYVLFNVKNTKSGTKKLKIGDTGISRYVNVDRDVIVGEL